MSNVTNQLKKHFQPYIQSIKDGNYSSFMEYQNQDNHLFYIEQSRWFKEIIHQSSNRFIFKPKIKAITLDNKRQGLMDFQLTIKRPSGRVKELSCTYQIKKYDTWKINDLPFLCVQTQYASIYYLNDQEEIINEIKIYIDQIIKLYKETFNWNSKMVVIKLYSKLEQISVTIPHFSIYGWNEANESIKIAIPHYLHQRDRKQHVFNVLSHEIAHTLLSQLTNDNAALFLQEGLAIYLEKSIEFSSGKTAFYSQGIDTLVKKTFREEGSLLSLKELSELDYYSGRTLYNQSFLFVNFLISLYGLEAFITLCKKLKNYPYINSRVEHKIDNLSFRSFIAIKRTYGSEKFNQDLEVFYKKSL
ncbi:hypothetical protein ERJ70_00315 [Sediminibacillus dalangtanensis]|uniref:Peptidase MA superfamily protein n=1 Tax=Sediminibacillus dalangtanensis TaxID=2729421 RepID=A0ABX7VUA3_9BACI|nr:hypothetical protein [Sediminibacillus dalangtanensis]QTM97917.1 hypothetical protein ERJ70_00315 [Sediminibacillus dalangtanensis]